MTMFLEYRTYARDRAISYEAIGVLSALTLPEFDISGATVSQLEEFCSDPPGSAAAPLTELAAAGYAEVEMERGEAVWRATDKAFKTVAETTS